MENKKTKKEFYTEILALVQGDADLTEFIEKQIGQLEKKAGKAKEKEADTLMDEVLAVLTDELQTIAQVVAAIGKEEITAAKVSYRLNKLVKEGYAEKGSVKVEKSKLVAYKVVVDEILAEMVVEDEAGTEDSEVTE